MSLGESEAKLDAHALVTNIMIEKVLKEGELDPGSRFDLNAANELLLEAMKGLKGDGG